jgi:catechol 2,3-dioxygenase-like lactoylglutathione lyase family enzyme
VNGQPHVRLARPSRNLAAAEQFWNQGLGLEVLYRKQPDSPGEEQHSLLMVGIPKAGWHLELTHDASNPVEPTPGPDDLLVLYLGTEIPADLVNRLQAHGGTRVAAHNPYWDRWGVTVLDPDGYRLVLSSRDWSNG